MRHQYISLATTLLLASGYSHALLADTVQDTQPEGIPVIDCFSTLGGSHDWQKRYYLTKDLTCDFDNAPVGTNAAITLLGKGTTLNLNGHTITCTNVINESATAPTDQLSSIGVHLAGSFGKLNGLGYALNNSKISGCQVAVEIGTASKVTTETTEIDTDTAQGYHQVTHVDATNCSAGFRVLSNNNVVKSNNAECGIIDDGNESAGFILSLRVANPELLPALNNNFLTLNTAANNNYGFRGLNSSKMNDDIIYKTTNVMSYNKANDNIDGFSIDGSGHLLKYNLSKGNRKMGISVSPRQPGAQPPQGSVMNRIIENQTIFNGVYGITLGEGNPLFNFGNIMKANFASGNYESDFFDANPTCAESFSDLATLNFWKWNIATGPVEPTCTLMFPLDAKQ